MFFAVGFRNVENTITITTVQQNSYKNVYIKISMNVWVSLFGLGVLYKFGVMKWQTINFTVSKLLLIVN